MKIKPTTYGIFLTFNAFKGVQGDFWRGIISAALCRQIKHAIQFTDFCIPEE
jgi:hypothetical protein